MQKQQKTIMNDNFKPLILTSFLTTGISFFSYYSTLVNAESVHPTADNEHATHTDMRTMTLIKIKDVTHETVASGQWKMEQPGNLERWCYPGRWCTSAH